MCTALLPLDVNPLGTPLVSANIKVNGITSKQHLMAGIKPVPEQLGSAT
jgi:hypothetical protein